jgi:hypothetical protein
MIQMKEVWKQRNILNYLWKIIIKNIVKGRVLHITGLYMFELAPSRVPFA